jgi:PhzF family phenazine biosynthesis protein
MRKYTVNAFSKIPGGGNPAGVVLHADLLKESEMQQMAEELNFSETAFIMASENALCKIRYFTPVEEVRLCGHATIASIGLMKHLKLISDGIHQIETAAGLLTVLVHPDKIMLEMEEPNFFESMDRHLISDSLGIEVDSLLEHPSPQIVSTGLKDLIVGVKSLEILRTLRPDFKKITDISSKADMAGYHVYSYGADGSVYMRNFAPLLGIQEESATGTASGALAVYLYKYGKLPKSSETTRTFFQGMFMERPSEIEILLRDDGINTKVFVGGGVSDINSLD